MRFFSVLESPVNESLPVVKNLVIDICKQFDLNASYASDLEKVSSVLKRNCRKEFQEYLRSKYTVCDYNPLYDTLNKINIGN